jgi:hypothetical protein
MMVIAPLGISDAGQQSYHFIPGIFDTPKFEVCKENCLYSGFIARGDQTGLVVTGKHALAQRIRQTHFREQDSLVKRLAVNISRYLARFAE